MSPNALATLMRDIDATDPLDFSDLSITEDDARCLMAQHFSQLDGKLRDAGIDAEGRVAIMAAIAAHTMEANFLLHLQLLRGEAGAFDLKAWMRDRGFGN